ncbi:MAG: hypothetical protein Q8S73_07170 [Deltaproteobacteria bacterium]|nr:hypothetical protein [Myxococcales bacterium]MDP3213867.1 hypothetical protein [Deltaproteobacteria bacterium]
MSAPDADLLALLDDSFERLCAQPVGAFLDPEAALATLDLLGDPERVAGFNERVMVPLRDRLLDRAAKSDVKLRDWLPDEAAARIVERAGRPRPLPPKMVDELVASERVRDGVKATLTEALTSFVQKASAGGGAAAVGGGMLRGALSFGAKAAGKMLGGVGEEIQRQLMDRVGDFVDGAMSNVQQRIAERLKSEETSRALGKRWGAGVAKALEGTEANGAKRLRRVAWAEIDAMAPAVVAHNAQRAALRATIADEVVAVAADLSGETVGSLLDAAGLREMAHAQWRRIGSAMMAGAGWKRATDAGI